MKSSRDISYRFAFYISDISSQMESRPTVQVDITAVVSLIEHHSSVLRWMILTTLDKLIVGIPTIFSITPLFSRIFLRFFALVCALLIILPLHVLSIGTTVVLVTLRVLPLFTRSHFMLAVRCDMCFGPTHEAFSRFLCKLRTTFIIFLVITILCSFLLIVCIVRVSRFVLPVVVLMIVRHFGSILQCRWKCASLSILQVLQRVLRRHRVNSRLVFGSVGIKNKSVCHESLECLLLVRVLVCCQHVHLSLLDELVEKLVSNQRFHHLRIVFKSFAILHDVFFFLLSTAEQFRHGFPQPEILPFSIGSNRHEFPNSLQ